MCVATDPSAGGRGEIKRASSHEENAWSRHQCLFAENLKLHKQFMKWLIQK